MAEFLRQHWGYLLAALALHVLFAGVFGLTMIQMSRNAPQPQLAIQAVVVDQSLLALLVDRPADEHEPHPSPHLQQHRSAEHPERWRHDQRGGI